MISTSDNVERAYQRLASECMVSKGYPDRKTYYMVDTFPVRSLLSPQPLSVEYARNSGYPSPTPPSRYASLEGSINMTEQEGKTYYGDNGKGGCREEAELKLYGSETLAGMQEEVTRNYCPIFVLLYLTEHTRHWTMNGHVVWLSVGTPIQVQILHMTRVRGTPAEQQNCD